MLKITKLAGRLRVIPQAGPTRLDGPAKHALNGPCQPFGAFRPQASCRPQGRKPRLVQAFTDIDVAKPGEDALIEKRRLQRPATGLQPRAQDVAPKAIAKGLRPQRLQQRMGRKGCRLGKGKKAEAPWIAQPEPRTGFRFEVDMIMGRGRRRTALEHGHATRHAEMLKQNGAVLEMPKQVFSAPSKAANALAGQPVCKAGGQWQAKIATPHLDACDRLPLKMRDKPPAGGFDFWKFRHDPAR